MQTKQEEYEKENQELDAKLQLQLQENSELLDQFNSLKSQHLKLVQEQSLNHDIINAKQRQLEKKEQEIKRKDEILGEKELEIVGLNHQVMIEQRQNQVSLNAYCVAQLHCSCNDR